jgi:hypothetical protein
LTSLCAVSRARTLLWIVAAFRMGAGWPPGLKPPCEEAGR